MMKKTLILAVVMLFACAAMANAWVISAAARNLAGGSSMGPPQFGNAANTTGLHPPATSGTVQMGILVDGVIYQKYMNTALPPDTQWTFLLWGNNFADPVCRIRFWIQQSTGMDMRPWEFRDAGTGEILWTGPVDTSKTTEANPWFEVIVPVINTTAPMEYAARYTFGPVPEPGSMIALCSGLIGLVGFGIRRRK